MERNPRPRRGRPRDTTIEDRVLDATRALLANDGFAAATMQAIAQRAGVPVSTLYRRWPSRVELIEEAAAPSAGPPGPPTGDLHRDLTAFAMALRDALTTPAVRAALPGLLAAYQSGETGRPPKEWLRLPWRRALVDLLLSAGEGSVASASPDAVFDLLLGAVLVQAFVPTPSATGVAEVDPVALFCRLIAPDGGCRSAVLP